MALNLSFKFKKGKYSAGRSANKQIGGKRMPATRNQCQWPCKLAKWRIMSAGNRMSLLRLKERRQPPGPGPVRTLRASGKAAQARERSAAATRRSASSSAAAAVRPLTRAKSSAVPLHAPCRGGAEKASGHCCRRPSIPRVLTGPSVLARGSTPGVARRSSTTGAWPCQAALWSGVLPSCRG